MLCLNCTSPLQEDWFFCPLCGLRKGVEGNFTVCSNCSYPVQEDWGFCHHCGTAANQLSRETKRFQDRLLNLSDQEITIIYDKMMASVVKVAGTVAPGSPPAEKKVKELYGSGVRAQVFEVIVRQAIAGAPWREICAGPMYVNGILPKEIEDEVWRRGHDAPPAPALVPRNPPPTAGGSGVELPLPDAKEAETQLLVDLVRELHRRSDS